ncbi:hypothetical protein PAMC26510_01415 [Caballeronia sordidicola]|uniref:Uncharacterized protein n=1 Tax=Caballeronia sordidicola TaxID=196367 RepID=A0A242NAD4_CABSO|nr:hypothetical protein PAMC26510_01415 [Caballeronia sordidicola]
MEPVAEGVAIAKVKDHLKDRHMVKVMAGLKFVAQRRQRTHCTGAQELPLETGDLREASPDSAASRECET